MHFGFSHYLHICISVTSSSVSSSFLTGLVFRLKLKIRTQLKKSMITSGEPLMLVALIACDPSIANVFSSRFVILKWKSRFVQDNTSVCLAKVDSLLNNLNVESTLMKSTGSEVLHFILNENGNFCWHIIFSTFFFSVLQRER